MRDGSVVHRLRRSVRRCSSAPIQAGLAGPISPTRRRRG